MQVLDLARKYKDYIVSMRRHFHMYPETAYQEVKTSARIREELDKMGIEVSRIGDTTGLLAKIEGKNPGKTFLLRADMDALPIQELNDVPYKSTVKGCSHACGHDCHIACLLGALKILNEMKDQFSGTILGCFQPAEETAIGSPDILKYGILDGVDACFAVHVWSEIPAGEVYVPDGPQMASGDEFRIEIHGKGGHGASPHLTVDAGLATAATVLNLQAIVSRNTDPKDTAVVSCGIIEAGTGYNVIPSTGRIVGTTRALSREVRGSFEEKIRRVAEGTAAAFGAEARVEYIYNVGPTINDSRIAALARASAKEVYGEDCLARYKGTMAAEDFAFYLEKIPGAMALVGVGNERCGACHPQHSPYYNVDEEVLWKASAYEAVTALDFLRQGGETAEEK